MDDKLLLIIKEFDEIEKAFLDPSVSSDLEKMKGLGKKRAKLEDLAFLGKQYFSLKAQIVEAKELLCDPEMKEMAQLEMDALTQELETLEEKLKEELTPKDPNDPKNIILEVRSGAGGEEAGIFAGELLRMYLRFAEKKGFSVELVDTNENDSGGVSEAVAEISGKNVYKLFKFESGVHRVQRIPKTESQGRIHTSTATVAVIPVSEENAEIKIKKEDVRVDTYRSSGAGGQHVNTTDSAIRLTHLPTGLVVTCQDGRSQHQNKEKAFQVLLSRLEQMEQEKKILEGSTTRSSQIGTGDRSEKIRTYNFPQDRLTDHRIKQNFSNLPSIMEGGIDDIIEACGLESEKEQV